jgi:hypothetical protein
MYPHPCPEVVHKLSTTKWYLGWYRVQIGVISNRKHRFLYGIDGYDKYIYCNK